MSKQDINEILEQRKEEEFLAMQDMEYDALKEFYRIVDEYRITDEDTAILKSIAGWIK